MKVADDKKVKAIYALVEDEIEQSALVYPDDLKAELDKRWDNYKKNGTVITATSAKKQIDKILKV